MTSNTSKRGTGKIILVWTPKEDPSICFPNPSQEIRAIITSQRWHHWCGNGLIRGILSGGSFVKITACSPELIRSSPPMTSMRSFEYPWTPRSCKEYTQVAPNTACLCSTSSGTSICGWIRTLARPLGLISWWQCHPCKICNIPYVVLDSRNLLGPEKSASLGTYILIIQNIFFTYNAIVSW